ncbi:MAG TPA: ABC transporter substrate-binding protein [Acidimicrobiales bacterium]|nr:ABC transporter substrate-binding protein [Acidimicrobiales bacterium]
MSDDQQREPTYAERMFPEPVDLGIAQPDRAVSSVEFGTESYLTGGRGEGSAWYEGGGAVGDRAVQGITIYPPTRGVVTQGDPFEPVKIGVLIDMDLGQLLADWIDPTILAIEDALNEGVFTRGPIQLIVADARGLPRENYRKVRDGYRWLVEQGCVVVLGPMISDNSLVLQDLANELKVACIGWTGAHRFASEYCFTVANGDIPTEGVMCAQWLAARGIEKVGMFWEQGSSGRDYADYFRDEALRQGLKIMREVKLEPNPRGLKDDLALMRELGVEGIYYGGYGYATFHFAEAFRALDWDPPRVMGTAFMFYSNSNKWAEGLEGWHGVDQLGEDGANPNYNAMVERFKTRFGRETRNVVVALAYDTARVAIHGIGNAAIPEPRWVKEGMERIRWMPATNGGPGTYIQFGPWDRKGYKGDFLTIRELRGGQLRFDGYHRPEWPSNRNGGAS